MKRIAVINQKGGTGKTTTAVNLAAGLAMAGYRTLLVDLDPQAHATIGIGLSPEDFPERTISEVLVAENPSFDGFIADTYLDQLKLVPSSIRLSRVASQLHSQNFREHRLAQAFEGLDGFDYAIIDCQPTLEVLPVNAMVAADCFLIPTQPAGYGLRGLSDLLDTLKGLRRQGPGSTARAWDWRVLLTMVMGQARGTNEIVGQLLLPLKERVLDTVIHRNERINRSQTEDQPRDIFAFDRHSRGAQEYQQLVEEILRIWPAHSKSDSPRQPAAAAQ